MAHDIPITRTYLADQEVARLLGVIAQAKAYMDKGEYGQARRVLTTGADTSVKVVSEVLAGRHVP